MIRIVPFSVSDLAQIPVQDRHAPTLGNILDLDEELIKSVAEGPWSWTAWSSYGIPVASCGIIDGSGEAWAILGSDLRRYMVPITRAVIDVLEVYPGTVSASISEDHEAAVRWARVLGFQRISPGRWART